MFNELESIDYINAKVGKVNYSKIFNSNKDRFVFIIDEYEFDYIILDKEYHINLIDTETNFDELYASYYEGVPKDIYSLNPLV